MDGLLPCSAGVTPPAAGPPQRRPPTQSSLPQIALAALEGVGSGAHTVEEASGPAAPDWDLAALAAANSAPMVTGWEQSPAGDVFVGDEVRIGVAASDADGNDIRVSLTFYGLPPGNCTAEQCGDLEVAATVPAAQGPAALASTVSYPRPGRYVVRAQASPARLLLVMDATL